MKTFKELREKFSSSQIAQTEGTVYIQREYEPGQNYDGDLKKLLIDIKKAGGKVKKIYKPSRREPNLAIEVDGNLNKIKSQIKKDDDGLTDIEE